MNQIETLLFDLDGTLLDSRDSVIDAIFHTTERYFPGAYSRTDLLFRFGESFEDFLQEIGNFQSLKINKEQIYFTYYEHVRQFHDQKVRMFPCVKEGLEQLKLAGYRLGIVTNKQRDLTHKGLQFGKIGDLFDTIVTLDDVTEGKPSAEPIIKAMNLLGEMEKEKVLMVGDSKYDVLAAQAAGVQSAVLEWYGKVDWLEATPVFHFTDFQQLVQNLTTVKTQ